jgi:hypothetical protein
MGYAILNYRREIDRERSSYSRPFFGRRVRDYRFTNECSRVASRPEAEAVASTTTTNSDWKTRYMQQIIDHLTLVVTDVEIAIHLQHNTSQIVVKGSDIE